jgi:hypothetical protein
MSMSELRYLLIPGIIGSILGSSLLRVFCSTRKDIGIIAILLGMVSGGFLGSFAGMMLAVTFHRTDEWPVNYWLSTICATLFTMGFLKFIRDNMQP